MNDRLPWLFCLVCLLASFANAQPAGPKVKIAATFEPATLSAGGEGTLTITLDVPAGLHAQSNKPLDENLIAFKITPTPNDAVTFGEAKYPAGELKNYPALGDLSIYEGTVVTTIPVKLAETAKGEIELAGTVRYQMCDDASCFPPANAKFAAKVTLVGNATTRPTGATSQASLEFTPTIVPETSTPPTTKPAAPPAIKRPIAAVSLFGHRIEINGLAIAIPLALFAGLLFNVMPCVLPVLPLKAIGFYNAAHENRAQSMILGGVFSLGLISVFATLGLLVVLSKFILGTQVSWGQWFSNPWIVWAIVAVLIVFGTSLLGVFTVNLPTSVYGFSFKQDTMGGNFAWGAFTAVLSTPCTAPLFPPLIGWAILQPVASSIVTMIAVGVGMASPYFVLSAMPEVAKKLPRTGPASELFKQMMAFLLFGTAAFFAGGKLFKTDDANLWLVFAVTVWAGLFLIVRTNQLTKGLGATIFSTGFAVLAAAIALLIALPQSSSAGDRQSTTTSQPSSNWSFTDYTPEKFKAARAAGQIVLIDFTADWCTNCKVIERTVYRDPAALAELSRRGVVGMKLDVDKHGWDVLNSLAPGQGIPFTAIYAKGPNAPPAVITSVYTAAGLIETLADF